MAKMYFNRTVKYKGIIYPPNTTIDIDTADVDSLKGVGGWIVEQAAKPKAAVESKQKEVEPQREKQPAEKKPQAKRS